MNPGPSVPLPVSDFLHHAPNCLFRMVGGACDCGLASAAVELRATSGGLAYGRLVDAVRDSVGSAE